MKMLLRPFALAAVLVVSLLAGGARAAAVRTAVGYRPAPVYHTPVASSGVLVGTATVAPAAIGTVVRTLPQDCTSVLVSNVAYQQCGNTWYRPSYSGSTVMYTIVHPPR
jgi:hypothetical protein